ncbi:MAG: GNAT family N-acetyltransferase [Xanthomonadaceae bacterium]|jgi:ribosomal protein S18 acetylase RimI-like enzyme|nr:GNAT family N-acetyltransferase [Xanthomonadaceae bacterium]
MSASLRVRQAGLADVARVAPLFDAYRGFYGQAADLALAQAFLRQRLASGESFVLLAERGDAALGFVQLYPLFSSVRARRILVLNDLYVAEAARRGGVAEALLREAEAFARAAGVLRLVLETGEDNRIAQRLYEKLGWRHVSESRWYERAVD